MNSSDVPVLDEEIARATAALARAQRLYDSVLGIEERLYWRRAVQRQLVYLQTLKRRYNDHCRGNSPNGRKGRGHR